MFNVIYNNYMNLVSDAVIDSNLYGIKIGEFKEDNLMKTSLSTVSNYMYYKSGDTYYAYICITNKKEYADKIKDNYKTLTNSIVVEEIESIEGFDVLLPKTIDETNIDEYCKSSLSLYEGGVSI